MPVISASTLRANMQMNLHVHTTAVLRHHKVSEIMQQTLDTLIIKYQELKLKYQDVNDFKLCSYFRPLCIKDDYGKQHLIKRKKCYAWLANTDPEKDAVTYAELLQGVYNVASGTVHPEKLPNGKTLIDLFNQWLIKQGEPYTCVLITCLCKRYQRITDGKYSTIFNLIMIKDLEKYLMKNESNRQ